MNYILNFVSIRLLSIRHPCFNELDIKFTSFDLTACVQVYSCVFGQPYLKFIKNLSGSSFLPILAPFTTLEEYISPLIYCIDQL